MSDDDGNNLVQLSGPIPNSGSPHWSPDGEKIAFDSKYQGQDDGIFVVDIAERVPRKLRTNVSKIGDPAWSRDGKWIYFQTFEALGHHIYRCPAGGGDAIAFNTDLHASTPQESWDGTYLYFASREVNHLLEKVPLAHPESEPVTEDMPRVCYIGLWLPIPGGIYFVPADNPTSISYFDFATRKVREVFRARTEFGDGLSISPDGRYLLYAQKDQENRSIMLAEPFY